MRVDTQKRSEEDHSVGELKDRWEDGAKIGSGGKHVADHEVKGVGQEGLRIERTR